MPYETNIDYENLETAFEELCSQIDFEFEVNGEADFAQVLENVSHEFNLEPHEIQEIKDMYDNEVF